MDMSTSERTKKKEKREREMGKKWVLATKCPMYEIAKF